MECKPIYEFILWNNCNNNCKFCFQRFHNHKGKILNEEGRIDSIEKVIEFINSDRFKFGSHVLIVGGELFDTKLNESEPYLYDLIDFLLSCQKENKIDLLYVNTNLIYSDTIYLEYLLKRVIKLDLQERLKFTTSYDVYGRYSKLEDANLFEKNLKMIRDCYPQIHTVVNMIMTKQFCEAVLNCTLNVKTFMEEYKVGVNTIPYIILHNYLAADKDQIYLTLIKLNNLIPGYLNSYINNLILPQDKLLYEYNNGELIFMSSKNSSCGHNENFKKYLPNNNNCFICDILKLKESINV